MPHLEIKYSSDIKLDCNLLFSQIEACINDMDPSAGICKARAYPSHIYSHTHVMIDLWLLPKKHRDDLFTRALLKKIDEAINKSLSKKCYVSIQIYYRDSNYITVE